MLQMIVLRWALHRLSGSQTPGTLEQGRGVHLVHDQGLDKHRLLLQGLGEPAALRHCHNRGDGHDDELGGVGIPKQGLCLLCAGLHASGIQTLGSHLHEEVSKQLMMPSCFMTACLDSTYQNQ